RHLALALQAIDEGDRNLDYPLAMPRGHECRLDLEDVAARVKLVERHLLERLARVGLEAPGQVVRGQTEHAPGENGPAARHDLAQDPPAKHSAACRIAR